MKTQMLLFLILFGIACTVLLPSCQKQELEVKQSPISNDPVTTRAECDPCDNLNDCCCFVQLNNDNVATIHICGTTDGVGACSGSAGPNCIGAMSGGGQNITLNSFNQKQIFCMDASSAIRIINTSGSDNAGIKVGCNTISVQPIQYTITPQDSVKANTNASCVLSDCT